ncbi:MAG: low temperature requirement protein A [Candidatus Dormibacteraceae bacterium]
MPQPARPRPHQIPRWRVPMIARDPAQRDRASTPLEAFFDLCFVVAVSQAAAGLHEKVAGGQIGLGVLEYAFVFFGIWWAWMNFTWFASAYDTDDVPYRLLTLLQIAGVLVYAAGIPQTFASGSFLIATIGYVIMRVALVTQWLRAAWSHPEGRATALRYAVLVAACQVGWILRLLVPGSAGMVGFAVLAGCELAVPWIAERGRQTSWNAGHINERFGLFTIIVVGESVAAATQAMTSAVSERGVSVQLAVLALAGLVLVFGIWWLYFKHDATEALDQRESGVRRRTAFTWGYGHYGIFAAIAATGAALDLAIGSIDERSRQGIVVAAFALAAPVALYLAVSATLHAQLPTDRRYLPLRYTYLAGLLCLLVAATALFLPLAVPVCGVALVVALLLAGNLLHAELRPPAEDALPQV